MKHMLVCPSEANFGICDSIYTTALLVLEPDVTYLGVDVLKVGDLATDAKQGVVTVQLHHAAK
jgi:hypothetical protein